MKENKYDEASFFEQYGKMNRSQKGLDGAGEWHILKEMLPGFAGKEMLDLGCGYGWHCRYAIEKGAVSVTGIDISEKMLQKARAINQLDNIKYEQIAIEDAKFAPGTFDIVFSSLTFHYIQSYDSIIRNIYHWLKPNGSFIFSVEHPVFTAAGRQDWIYDEEGNKLHWAVDNYFSEGQRNTSFLGEHVLKYHRTIATYMNGLIKQGFKITAAKEPLPSKEMLKNTPDMKDELRRPMMLLISAEK